MLEVKWYIMAYIPFKIIPVASLYSIFLGTVHQCMHFACKQVGQNKAACHK